MRVEAIGNQKDSTSKVFENKRGLEIAGETLQAVFYQIPMLKLQIKSKSFDSDGTLNLRFDNKKGTNHVSIKLNEGNDTYELSFHECRVLSREPFIINEKKNEIKGIYWDQFPEILKENLPEVIY